MRRRSPELSIEALRAYAREAAKVSLGRLQQGLLLGIIIVPAFGVLDLLTVPERAPFFVKLRLVVALCLAVIFWASTRHWTKRVRSTLRVVSIVIAGMMINVMIRYTGGYESTYYAGLSLVFLVATVIVRFNVRESAIGCGACYLVYLFGIAAFDDVENFRALANNNFFLLSSLIVALVGSYLSESLERREFLARFHLLSANRKLRELDQMKSQFFASVSHELRTPLTLLLAPTESLLAEEAGRLPAPSRRFVEIIHANALKLLKQINDLLDLARLDARRMELVTAPTDLGALVTGVVRTAEPLARQRGIELRSSVERTADSVVVDGEKVEKIVLNLLSNALKFTPAGGRVEVSLRQAASGARIVVEDTGIGIARKDIDRIFDRFAQVDGSTTRRYPGSGIGLALVKELVELHGGWVDVESHPGVGSRFAVTFPVAGTGQARRQAPPGAPAARPSLGLVDLTDLTNPPAVSQAPVEVAVVPAGAEAGVRVSPRAALPADWTRAPRAAAGRPTVVVVEDNAQLREFLTTLLGREHRVVAAEDGEEGLAVVRTTRPDLVVADVMMPRKSGLDLCRELKDDADPALATTPILLLTAKAELAHRLDGYEKGADDYLVKPFNSKELLARVRVLLRMRALEQALARRNAELSGELSSTRDQLIQSEKLSAVGQLAAGVAHEINNPLTSIISFAQLLLKGRVSAEDARRCLELIASEGERAARIIRSLLAFARKHTPERSLTSITSVLDTVIELRLYALGKAGVEVTRRYSDLPAIMVDAHQLQQVFLNILINAEQALAERRGGHILVETELAGDIVRVRVSDDGPGIAPEDLSRVFEPFYSTKEVGQGTGLGLSICYGIIEEHGGRIVAESGVGRGATFVIELPVEAPRPSGR